MCFSDFCLIFANVAFKFTWHAQFFSMYLSTSSIMWFEWISKIYHALAELHSLISRKAVYFSMLYFFAAYSNTQQRFIQISSKMNKWEKKRMKRKRWKGEIGAIWTKLMNGKNAVKLFALHKYKYTCIHSYACAFVFSCAVWAFAKFIRNVQGQKSIVLTPSKASIHLNSKLV